MNDPARPPVSTRGKLLRGGLDLLMGHGVAQLMGLARNFLVARMLTPDQFGIASTFVVTIAIIEACSSIGLDKYMVQNKRGDDVALQRLIHTLAAVRGLITGAIIFVLAQPIADLFGIPHVVNSFRVLALVPIIRGLWHSDIKRLQRGLSFQAEAMASVAAQAGGLVVAVGLAYVLRDYTAMLWGVIAYVSCYVGCTHLLAERRYGFAYDPVEARKVMAFGWPLTLNGLVIVGAMQGDRVVVGANLGMAQLGLYSAVTTLLNAVVGVSGAVISGVALPWLSAVQADRAAFARRHEILGVGFALAMVAIYAPFALLGADVVGLIFGAVYQPDPELMAALGLTAALRFLRVWHATAGLALSQTKSILVGNLVRPVGLLFALGLVWGGHGLSAIALAIAAGEGLGFVATVLWLDRAAGLAAAPVLRIAGPGLGLLLGLAAWTAWGEIGLAVRLGLALAALGLAAALPLVSVEGRRLYALIFDALRRRLVRRGRS